MSSELLRDRLIAAKAVIDSPEKWMQGGFTSDAGQHCMAHAVAVAYDRSDYARLEDDHEAYRALAEAIGAAHDCVHPEPVYVVCWFNNHASHDRVMDVFDCAIAANG